MSRRSKKQKYKLDPKKFETPGIVKKDKEAKGEDLFKEILRSKPKRRY